MSRVSSSGSPISTTSGTIANRSKTTPSIQNVSLTLASTEYTITIPSNSVEFSIRTRKDSKLQLAFNSTESGTTFITIWPGETYTETALTSTASLTLYVQSSKANEILEIWSWT